MTTVIKPVSIENAAFANHCFCNLLYFYCFGHESISVMALDSRSAEGWS